MSQLQLERANVTVFQVLNFVHNLFNEFCHLAFVCIGNGMSIVPLKSTKMNIFVQINGVIWIAFIL